MKRKQINELVNDLTDFGLGCSKLIAIKIEQMGV